MMSDTSDENNKSISGLKHKAYAKFRTLHIMQKLESTETISLTDDEIDNFRDMLALLAIGEVRALYRITIHNQHFMQMLSEYACLGFKSLDLAIPDDFHIHCKYWNKGESYSRLFQLIDRIQNKDINLFCTILPYIVATCDNGYELEKRDIPILERIAYSIMTKTYIRGSKRVDITCDFMDIQSEFKRLIDTVFKDTNADTRYIMRRVFYLFREIAILWCVNVLQRTRTNNELVDKSVSLILTRRLAKYSKITNTI